MLDARPHHPTKERLRLRSRLCAWTDRSRLELSGKRRGLRRRIGFGQQGREMHRRHGFLWMQPQPAQRRRGAQRVEHPLQRRGLPAAEPRLPLPPAEVEVVRRHPFPVGPAHGEGQQGVAERRSAR